MSFCFHSKLKKVFLLDVSCFGQSFGLRQRTRFTRTSAFDTARFCPGARRANTYRKRKNAIRAGNNTKSMRARDRSKSLCSYTIAGRNVCTVIICHSGAAAAPYRYHERFIRGVLGTPSLLLAMTSGRPILYIIQTCTVQMTSDLCLHVYHYIDNKKSNQPEEAHQNKKAKQNEQYIFRVDAE